MPADNKALLAARGKLPRPVLALGAGEALRRRMADELRFVATM